MYAIICFTTIIRWGKYFGGEIKKSSDQKTKAYNLLYELSLGVDV